MMKLAGLVGLGLLTMGAVGASAALAPAVQARGAERLEISGIKAVRPALVNTVAALRKGDAAGAKAAFEAYDSGWNGIEVYINTRSKDMYNELEKNYQARITAGLSSPKPDTTALLADAQAMLAKYDEAISLVEKAAPLNPLYDDVARLRSDSRALDAIRSSDAGLIDASGSISMVVNERVVWDFVNTGELSPKPSILNPDSLEAAIDRQGYQPWELKRPVADRK